MPIRMCRKPGCPNRAVRRGYCGTHARRPPAANARIYRSKRWRLLSAKVIRMNPICGCGQPTVDVHHVVDIQDGGDPWALANLQALCKSCHGRVTRARQ